MAGGAAKSFKRDAKGQFCHTRKEEEASAPPARGGAWNLARSRAQSLGESPRL